MTECTPPSYWDYLRIPELLSLQGGLEADEGAVSADELTFIAVHQVYELWLKVVIREVREARDRLRPAFVEEEEIPRVVHHLDRVREILRLAEEHWRVMETLPPQDFLAFRDKLVPASGFQSFQVRELEILLGLPDEARVALAGTNPIDHIRALAAASPGGRAAWSRLEAARAEPTLKEVLAAWLFRTPIRGSGPDDPGDDAVVAGFLADYLEAVKSHHARLAPRMAESLGERAEALADRFAASTEGVRRFLAAEDRPAGERARRQRIRAGILFIESYRDRPLLAWPRTLLDRVVEVEQQLVIWRARHARMVERTIGRRIGTGGSSGVDYLDKTTTYRVFDDLWAVRTVLLPKEALPPGGAPGEYGFAR